MVPKEEAEEMYHSWLSGYLSEDAEANAKAVLATLKESKIRLTGAEKIIIPGSLLHVASGLLRYEEVRTRKPDEPRSRGKINVAVFAGHKKQLQDFLDFMNNKHGQGSLARMRLEDLSMRSF